jgi:hypothetical protein
MVIVKSDGESEIKNSFAITKPHHLYHYPHSLSISIVHLPFLIRLTLLHLCDIQLSYKMRALHPRRKTVLYKLYILATGTESACLL